MEFGTPYDVTRSGFDGTQIAFPFSLTRPGVGARRDLRARSSDGRVRGECRRARHQGRRPGAAYAAGQAAAVGHVAAHELGAAAYAIRAVWAAATKDERVQAGRSECRWQRDQLPREIRELVLDDQRLRNELCWFAFDC